MPALATLPDRLTESAIQHVASEIVLELTSPLESC